MVGVGVRLFRFLLGWDEVARPLTEVSTEAIETQSQLVEGEGRSLPGDVTLHHHGITGSDCAEVVEQMRAWCTAPQNEMHDLCRIPSVTSMAESMPSS